MSLRCGLRLVLACALGVAGIAVSARPSLAVDVPTLPTPTVPTPTVPIPTPTVPTPTVPSVPLPVQVPAPPTVSAPAPAPSAPAPVSAPAVPSPATPSLPATVSAAAPASRDSTPSDRGAADSPRAQSSASGTDASSTGGGQTLAGSSGDSSSGRYSPSRRYSSPAFSSRSAGRAHRSARLPVRRRFAVAGHERLSVFVLRVGAGHTRRLRIRVQQLAPTCRDLGTIVRRLPAARSRVAVPARIDGRAFEPGTYRLDIGRRDVVVAVFAAHPSPAEVRAQLRENACDAPAVSVAATLGYDRWRLRGTPATRASAVSAAGSRGNAAGSRGSDASAPTETETRGEVASAIFGAGDTRGGDSRTEVPVGEALRNVVPETVSAGVKPVLFTGVFAAALLLLLAGAAAAIPDARAAAVVARDLAQLAVAALVVSAVTTAVLLLVGA